MVISYKSKTFDQLNVLYLNDVKYTLKKSSIIRHSEVYRQQVKPIFGKLTVEQVTRVVLNKWKKYLFEKEYSQSTISHAVDYLKCLYKYHVMILRGITNSCIAYLKPFKVNPEKIIKKRAITIWSLEDIFKFLNECDKLEEEMLQSKNKNYYHGGFSCTKAIVALCSLAGLRIGEALALQVKDLIVKDDITYVNIYKTKSISFHIKDPKVLTSCKSKCSIRQVPIPQILKDLLFEQIKTKKLKKNYFFSSGNEYPLSDFVKKIKAKVEKSCNLPHTTLHELRHSYVYMLLNQGISPLKLAKLLGHSSVDIVYNEYYQLLKNDQTQIINVLDESISKLKINFKNKI